MEELLVQIADLLDMSVEGVIQTYPILREQFIAYHILESVRRLTTGIMMWSPLLLVVCILVVLLLDTAEIMSLEDITSLTYSKVRWLLAIALILMAISLVSRILVGVLATDILIIREFL